MAHEPNPREDALLGRSIAHFRVEAKLGEGGMGVVYRALDETLRRPVALKVLPPSYTANEERRARFLREARAAAAITHPNVAAVYEIGEAEGLVFIAMELVLGTTLRAIMKSRPLHLSEAVRIAKEIAKALAKAHDKGIVHRDLKPDNVMLTEDGEVKVLDFGLAKLREETTRKELEEAKTATPDHTTNEGRILGTTGYISPEQALGRGVDHRTDIFAFGVVLYEMVTSTHPFLGDSSLEILIAATRDLQVPASKLNAAVFPELEGIIEKCLAKNPEGRFADARELSRALDALPGSRLDVPAPPSTASLDLALAPTRLDRTAMGPEATRRRRPPLVLFAMLGALAVAGAVYVASSRRAPASAASTSASDAAEAPIPITSLPPPKTARPEAAAAYAAALQAMRDASMSTALAQLRHAVQLDPTFAAAHIELALERSFRLGLDEQREHVARAQSARSALDARGLALLEIAEAIAVGEDADFKEVTRRARAAAAKFPNDAEIALLLGHALCSEGALKEGFAEMDRATMLDPAYAAPPWARSIYESEAGDRDAALASAKRCLDIAHGATSCLRVRADIEDARGECDAVEKDARTMVALDPRAPRGFEYLAIALAANGAPAASIGDALHKRAALIGDEAARKDASLEDEANLAAFTGDFDRAIRATREELEAHSLQSSESAFARTGFLLAVYEEIGDDKARTAAAKDYAERLRGWVGDAPAVARPLVLSALRDSKTLSTDSYERLRDQWVQEARRKYPRYNENLAWLDFFARPERNEADAKAALAEQQRFSPLPGYEGHILYEEAIGRTYLHAGNVVEAERHLGTAARACKSLKWPVEAVRAHAMLGAALEAKGDAPSACRQYGEVVAHWGQAKPRSVTFRRVRERMLALHCDRAR